MDVREIPCSIKHGLILPRLHRNCQWAAISSCSTAATPHLREEIANGWPGAFAWEYLVQNPDEVRVKITKLQVVKDDTNLPTDHNCSH